MDQLLYEVNVLVRLYVSGQWFGTMVESPLIPWSDTMWGSEDPLISVILLWLLQFPFAISVFSWNMGYKNSAQSM